MLRKLAMGVYRCMIESGTAATGGGRYIRQQTDRKMSCGRTMARPNRDPRIGEPGAPVPSTPKALHSIAQRREAHAGAETAGLTYRTLKTFYKRDRMTRSELVKRLQRIGGAALTAHPGCAGATLG